MVSQKESLRETKVLRNYLNLTKQGQDVHLDYVSHLEMLRGILTKADQMIKKRNLPTFQDIKKHNQINGSTNSKYINN